ncbi:group II intron reverse transcriptase/maturase [Bacillus thermotolerans]|uniref:group II intron reverse transcriptase/maturase n=1 Tax=Bacillus thermotolerans TaxID=1221996 RepID=UPI000589013D|nr:group II intron reverse transcriptase/maturase [Bacillus thermotolerans]KKB43846.1 Retron-type RNA-directed DNA polymerase [Bacillus thermotolerans]
MNTSLRHNEYYNMQGVFDDLYARSKDGETFSNLLELILEENNILLAYRNIKANKGSKTAGTDEFDIDHYKGLKKGEFIELIKKTLMSYKPKAVRRVFISKANGGKRPLGIPTMLDRLIQQMFKQILEPICEAKFYKYSFGLRPLRSTAHAIARTNFLVNIGKLHYVVDIDIKGFFDNVNHRLLIKQLWNIGIRDRRVLAIINKMLKAPIKGEGIPTKGTPQGGILSPLLSNVVLNDLDQWVASQWDNFQTNHSYSQESKKYLSLKRSSNLKEGFIVRYADDFKIFSRDWKTAYKWFHAVKDYLKNRLKLDISPEKSKVVNLRKRASDFLGYKIRAVPNGNKYTVRTNMKDSKKDEIKRKLRQLTKKIQSNSTYETVKEYNAYVAGIQNYFQHASMVGHDLMEIEHGIFRCQYNRLKKVAKFGLPHNPSPIYKKRYSLSVKTWRLADIHLFPIRGASFQPSYQFNPRLNLYTEEGRQIIHRQINPEIEWNILRLMRSNSKERSVEYHDNRISRYSMKNGKCEITGEFLNAEDVHCHHYLPVSMGGTDKFDNLRIVHKEIHQLIHATKETTIDHYLTRWQLNDKQMKKLNQYRKQCNLFAI